MAHLRRTAHRRRQPPTLTLHLVSPVDVGVDLHDRHRASIRIRLQNGNGNGVVAAEHHRHGTGSQHRLAGVADRGAVGLECRVVPRHIADVDRGRSVDEHRTTEVEVEMVADPRIGRRRSADRSRRILAIRSDGRVRRRARCAEHDDVGTEQKVDGRRRKSEERLIVCRAEHRAKTCHRHSLVDSPTCR